RADIEVAKVFDTYPAGIVQMYTSRFKRHRAAGRNSAIWKSGKMLRDLSEFAGDVICFHTFEFGKVVGAVKVPVGRAPGMMILNMCYFAQAGEVQVGDVTFKLLKVHQNKFSFCLHGCGFSFILLCLVLYRPSCRRFLRYCFPALWPQGKMLS